MQPLPSETMVSKTLTKICFSYPLSAHSQLIVAKSVFVYMFQNEYLYSQNKVLSKASTEEFR